MTRDEILEAIETLSTAGAVTPGLPEVRSRMAEVARLADQYPDSADRQYLVEALADALDGFADMIGTWT